MKKICYVVTIPTTIKAFFIPQLRYLAANGFDVTVVCSPGDRLQAELGDTVRFVPMHIPRGLSPVGMLRAIVALCKFFKRERFDLIQYSTPNAALCASLAAWLAGCKKRNYHLMGFRYLGANGIIRAALKIFEKITCRYSTSIECVSQSNLALGVKEKLFPRDKVTVVWNGSTGGVNLAKFDFSQREKWRSEVRRELGYSDSDFIFGFVGRITRDKGINEILAAYRPLQKSAKLLFVGSAEGLDTLDQALLTEARANKNIQFHDSVRDIERYFAAIDVLLLPSYREGFGNVIIEAAACGTPAIISDIPGPIDAIEVGKTALVVPARDADALAVAMSSMCENEGFSPAVCATFVRERFDGDRLCERIYARKCELLQVIE